MLDCGAPLSRIREANNFDLSKIVACLVSHEHGDHAGYLEKLGNETTIPIYCTAGTVQKFGNQFKNILKPNKIIKPGGNFTIFPIELKHDVECFGFIVATGKDVLYYATDTSQVNHQIPGLTHLMIEANHSIKLISESTSKHARKALANHLDIDSVVEFCRMHRKTLKEVCLLHLSGAHSDADKFQKMVACELGIPVYVAEE